MTVLQGRVLSHGQFLPTRVSLPTVRRACAIHELRNASSSKRRRRRSLRRRLYTRAGLVLLDDTKERSQVFPRWLRVYGWVRTRYVTECAVGSRHPHLNGDSLHFKKFTLHSTLINFSLVYNRTVCNLVIVSFSHHRPFTC